EKVQSPKAYLSTIVVRLCINQAESARAQREVYVGSWLPEPILTSQRTEMVETVMLGETLSFAFLVLLEQLGPLERAVFLLREVFEYDYPEIAEIVDKSEANCRQILRRAHQHLDQRSPRFDVSREQQARLTEQFLRASTSGDMQGLLNLLTDDIVFTGDGGGKVPVALKPVHGPDKVARGTTGGLRFFSEMQTRLEEVNGQPAIVGYLNGHPCGVLICEIEGERIRRIYAVVNPEKLHWLGKQTA
ncbi:MAG: sigma factor-like helix-turn-helix DNA-binding protein, partial [Ktedonobacteraceae bacterium]